MRLQPGLPTLLITVALVGCELPVSAPVAPPTLGIVSGDGQQGAPGSELPDPLVVVLKDHRNRPIRDQVVNFNVVTGGGSVFGGTAVTDKDGIASDYWTLGIEGDQRVEARAVAPDGEKFIFAVFSATVVNIDLDGDGYTLDDCDDSDPIVNPGADDRPDGALLDSNCDGVDGSLSEAVLVSTAGLDAADCGTISVPCASVRVGIQRAVALGVADVYVAAGTYTGTVQLTGGVNVYGGFSPTFDARDPAVHVAELIGSGTTLVGATMEAVTILAEGLTAPTEIADLRIVGRNVTAINKSSFAVVVRNTEAGRLTLTRNRIVGGMGGPGATGATGGSASQTRAGSGAPGAPGAVLADGCNDETRGLGGARGTNGTATAMAGGAGGHGGTEDTDCDDGIMTGEAGLAGANAATLVAGTSFGLGGAAGGTCQAGTNGQHGRTQHGANGAGAASGHTLVGELWRGMPGSVGALGVHGTGGGGGGGAGGCSEAYGAGGGGGGAAGLRAPAVGGAGGPAGGSFAVYLIASSPSLVDNVIERGTGGTGGRGGSAGLGQPGGFGGAGGAAAADAGAGGNGGNGGDGGNSGAGGGGAGGISAGIVRVGVCEPVLTGNTFTGGAGGAGGEGGPSQVAPSNAGASGLVIDELTL